MQVELPEQTIRDVQALLARRGEAGNVSQYIDQTLQRTLFFEAVREVKRRNAGVDPQELERLIDEAVDAVRAERRGTVANADGA